MAGQISDRGERKKVEGLRLRHSGTICLLRGDLETASFAFDELLEKQRSEPETEQGQRVQSIHLYKRARVYAEKVRTWLPIILWHHCRPTPNCSDSQSHMLKDNGEPRREELIGWLTAGEHLLHAASQTLGRLRQGDRKWFPAVDFCIADIELLRARLASLEAEPSQIRSMLDRTEDLIRLVAARLPSSETAGAGGRPLDIETGLESIECQRQVAEGTSCSHSGFVSEIQKEFAGTKHKPEHQLWDSYEVNPYKLSRKDYERMYNLWKLSESLSPIGEHRTTILEIAARTYRQGASRLYGYGMSQSACGLHHIALACFAESSANLQELLEATVCLAGNDRRPIYEVLDRIAIESLLPTVDLGDHFFTIPTKVVCRLVGDHEMYGTVVATGGQPVKRPQPQPGDRNSLVTSARKLAISVTLWAKQVNWDELRGKARISQTMGEQHVLRSQRRVLELEAWLLTFVTY